MPDCFRETCDACDQPVTEGDRFVEIRVQRPSDPADMSCIMAGHERCFPGQGRTPEEWDEWIETEGRLQGYLWLT